MNAKKAILLIGLGAAVWWAYKVNSEDKPEWFDEFSPGRFLDPISDAIDAGWSFVKTGAENIYGETFGYWDMKASPSIKRYLMEKEKYMAKAYDAKPPSKDMTIGYGHKIFNDEKYLLNETWSPEKAKEVFDMDVDYRRGSNHVNKALRVEVSQPQFDALVSFVFNYGQNAPAFKKLMSIVNSGDHAQAAEYIRNAGSPWKGQMGNKYRRTYEAELYKSGSVD